MKDIKLINVFYKPGYSDMRGGYHSAELKKTEGNKWVVECNDREDHRSPNIVTVYAAADEAVADLEKFLARERFKSLEKRLKSDMFITDYSPWRISIEYVETVFGKTTEKECNLAEYRVYTKRDRDFLSELKDRFGKLKGEKISERTEKD